MLEENTPALWKSHIRVPGANSHKYTRGHAIVVGGGMASTGAARLAAISALRAGAGLVSVACTPESLPIYAAALTAVMTKPVKNISELVALLEDERVTATLIGPGCGISETTREQVLQILALKKPCVLDADALTAFKNDAKTLASAIHAPTILTPHEGEFARLFSLEGDRETRARAAAQQSNAVVVLKGAETIIAAPDGSAVINKNAPGVACHGWQRRRTFRYHHRFARTRHARVRGGVCRRMDAQPLRGYIRRWPDCGRSAGCYAVRGKRTIASIVHQFLVLLVLSHTLKFLALLLHGLGRFFIVHAFIVFGGAGLMSHTLAFGRSGVVLAAIRARGKHQREYQKSHTVVAHGLFGSLR
jgi:hydroxyethylthiazole kinase-like uncharacterized protein yjeF